MKDIIANILGSKEGLITTIITVIVGINILLTGLKKLVDYMKDKTGSKIDNDISNFLGMILGWISKGLEFLSANSTALPPKAKQEIEEDVKK